MQSLSFHIIRIFTAPQFKRFCRIALVAGTSSSFVSSALSGEIEPDLASEQSQIKAESTEFNAQIKNLIAAGATSEATPMAQALIQFSVEPRLSKALVSLALDNVATGQRFELPLNKDIQLVSLPAGVYQPDIKGLSQVIYGAQSATKISAPSNTQLTLSPNAVTYLGDWSISQSRTHSGFFAKIGNRKTELRVGFDSVFQPWVEKYAADATLLPLHASAFGQQSTDNYDWPSKTSGIALSK